MRKWRWRKVLLFLLGLAPLFWLGWRAWDHRLTANPLEFITHYTGDWTLRLIIISLIALFVLALLLCWYVMFDLKSFLGKILYWRF